MNKHHYHHTHMVERNDCLWEIVCHITYRINTSEQDGTREHPGREVEEVEVELIEPFSITHLSGELDGYVFDKRYLVEGGWYDMLCEYLTNELNQMCETGYLSDELV